MSGKVALVTGSSHGIGREIARELAPKGARAPSTTAPTGRRERRFSSWTGAAKALWGGRGRRKLGAEPRRGCRTRDGRDRRLNQQRGDLRGPPCIGGIPVLDRKMTKLVSVLARDRP
jgi:NAD(P)-dependent dehydrogenase (short-subunit alcohol dehydrogenase family)